MRLRSAGSVAAALLAGMLALSAWGAEVAEEQAEAGPLGALTEQEERIVKELMSAPDVPRVADERNAAKLYMEAGKRFQEEYLRGENLAKWEEASAAGKDAVESGLPEPMPPTEEGGEAGPYYVLYRTKGMECRFDADWEEGPMTELPHLSVARDVARLLSLQASFDCDKGRLDRVIEHTEMTLELARHLSREPALISQMASMLCEIIGMGRLMEVALEKEGDKEFLEAALRLIETGPRRQADIADRIRSDARLSASWFVRRASDPEANTNSFADDLHVILSFMDTLTEGEEYDPSEQEAADVFFTRRLEMAAGLGEGSFNYRTFRTIVSKWATFMVMEADRIAGGLERAAKNEKELRALLESEKEREDKPEALLARLLSTSHGKAIRNGMMASERRGTFMVMEADRIAGGLERAAKNEKELRALLESEKEREDKPEALLARLLLTGHGKAIRIGMMASEGRRLSALVLRELIAGKKSAGGAFDSFGNEYKVTWFENSVYFETSGYVVEPHDLDISVGDYMSRKKYEERKREASPK